MAQEPKELFSIDAGKLLAKLHVAGRQLVNNPKVIVINTAILNDAGESDPKNIGKQTFKFDKTGKYEVGIITPFEYVPPYEELYQDYDKKVTENQELESDKIKEIEEAMKKENEERKKNKEKNLDALKKNIFKWMLTYFQNFVGKDNCKKLLSTTMVALPFSAVKSIKDIKLKGNTIEPDKKYSEECQKKLQEQFEKEAKAVKDPGKAKDICKKPSVSPYICFKVGYSAELEVQ